MGSALGRRNWGAAKPEPPRPVCVCVSPGHRALPRTSGEAGELLGTGGSQQLLCQHLAARGTQVRAVLVTPRPQPACVPPAPAWGGDRAVPELWSRAGLWIHAEGVAEAAPSARKGKSSTNTQRSSGSKREVPAAPASSHRPSSSSSSSPGLPCGGESKDERVPVSSGCPTAVPGPGTHPDASPR